MDAVPSSQTSRAWRRALAWACLLCSFLPLLVVFVLYIVQQSGVFSVFFLLAWVGLLWPFIQHRRGRELSRGLVIVYVLALIVCVWMSMPFLIGFLHIH